MKIICSWCKKLIGEKEPFGDTSETYAKCPTCNEKQEGVKKYQYADGDVLDFYNSYEHLKNLILKVKLPNTLGLYGPWGSGKTRMIEYLCKEFKSKGRPSLIFDAWQYRDDIRLFPSIIKCFYSNFKIYDFRKTPTFLLFSFFAALLFWFLIESLKSELQNFYSLGMLGSSILFIIIILWLKNLSDYLSAVESICKFFSPSAKQEPISSEEINKAKKILKHIVDKALKKSGLNTDRVVVFIDNLDRCMPDKVVNLIEDITNFCLVDNCLFVLVMDKQHVILAIKQKYPGFSGRAYLEKIIKVRFEMPIAKASSNSTGITAYFKKHFCEQFKILSGKDLEQKEVSNLDNFLNCVLSTNWLATPRQVEKLAQSLAQASLLKPIESESQRVGVLILMITKEYFPQIFWDIWDGDKNKLRLFNLLGVWSLRLDMQPNRLRDDPDVLKNERPSSRALIDEYIKQDKFYTFLRMLEKYKSQKEYQYSIGPGMEQFSDLLIQALPLVEVVG